MRAAKALFCAAALLALFVPEVRADDYNKLTYFTFSAPVQVPGATLPAGNYTFKLADPESGRRAIQIWDRDGNKLLTTLLTMTDERMEIPKEPMVMFKEQPSGEAPAVRAWYYEGDRAGYEFVYPKDQAMKIARASHQPVLTTEETASDLSALKAAKVSRVDETGAFADASSTTAQSASTTSQSTSSAPIAPATTTASTSTDSTTAAAPPATATTSTSAVTDSASATTAAPEPSANRTEPTAAVARTDATVTAPEPVATTGSVQADSAAAPATSSASPQAEQRPVTQVARNRNEALPRTASSLSLFGLLSGICLAAGLSVRHLRKRLA